MLQTSFCSSWSVYQLSACQIWMWYKDAFVLFMEIPLFLMCLALWQEAFQVHSWTLLFRLIYGLLSAVSCHLFRKKCNGLISQPRARQASVRMLKIYVSVQHNFHLRKQGDLPEQAAVRFCKLFQLWNCYSWVFSFGALVTGALGFDTMGVFSCFRVSLLWWKSLSTNAVTLLQLTKVWRLRCEKCPRKGQIPSGY